MANYDKLITSSGEDVSPWARFSRVCYDSDIGVTLWQETYYDSDKLSQ